MATVLRGWRWRRNPLRRRSDVVEAWTVLVVAVLVLIGAPLAGALAGWWAHEDATARAAEQRAGRHHVVAEVVGRPPTTPMPSADGGQAVERYPVRVRWTEPGGAVRTAIARVTAGTRQGDPVDVWIDGHGRSVSAPADRSAVWQRTVTLGVAVAGGTAAAVLLGHAVARRAALRHRLGEWDREWADTGPDWSRRGA